MLKKLRVGKIVKFLNMNNFYKLSEKEMATLKGGRDVKKHDIDGDGDWDIKVVRDKEGKTKKIKYNWN